MLHDGFISSVTARIPWPNPLTSTLGFSVDSLHLTFHLRPRSNTPVHASSNLANSVTSVAESFIHEELTPQEEATLLESFHPDLVSSGAEYNFPGGLEPDPFLSTPEEDTHDADVDPDGVSIFAALFERLLARFEFHAVNTKITLVQPGNISLTVSIPELRYRTEANGAVPDALPEHGLYRDKSRSIAISGLTVTTNNLRASIAQTPSQTTLSPRSLNSPALSLEGLRISSPSSRSASPAPISPASSSSEEDIPFEMSQSIAFLPPRHGSPTASMTSSMYQSAISTPPASSLNRASQNSYDEIESLPASHRQEIPQSPFPSDPKSEEQSLDESIVVSFGSHPILIRLGIHQSAKSPVEFATTSQKPLLPPENTTTHENLHFSVTSGVIACALQGWHIRALADLTSLWTANQLTSSSSSSTTVGPQPNVELVFESLGLVLLLLPPEPVESSTHHNSCLGTFFKEPLLPSKFHHGYLRLFLERITGSMTSTTHSEETVISTGLKQPHMRQGMSTNKLTFYLSLGDISLFSVDNMQTPKDGLFLYASPVLITDPSLPFQDASSPSPLGSSGPNTRNEFPHLPMFEIMDWTNKTHHGFQPMVWRSKGKNKHHVTDRSTMTGPPIVHTTAFTLHVARQQYPLQRKPVIDVESHVVPMHIFVDLEQVLRKEGNWSFLSEAIGDGLNSANETLRSDLRRGGVDHLDSEVDTPSTSPRIRSAGGKQKERQSQENFVLKDLDLDFDYISKNTNFEEAAEKEKGPRKVEFCLSALFNVSYSSFVASRPSVNCKGIDQD